MDRKLSIFFVSCASLILLCHCSRSGLSGDSRNSNLSSAPIPSSSLPAASPAVASGLAAHYTFETITGNFIPDDSGHGISGTYTGGVAFTSGFRGQALKFDGLSGEADMTSNINLKLGQDLTLSVFVQTTNSVRTEALISNYDATASETGYILSLDASGHPSLRIGGLNLPSGIPQTVTDLNSSINDGRWHHIAVTITLGIGVQFYIDGAPASFHSLPVSAFAGPSIFQMAVSAWPYYGTFFTGSLDEIEVYTRTLSSSEIAQLASGILL